MKSLIIASFLMLTIGDITSQENLTAGEEILSRFNCIGGVETQKIDSQIEEIKSLYNDINNSDNTQNCKDIASELENIPESVTLIDQMLSNQFLQDIKVKEREIEALEKTLDHLATLPPDDEQRNWLGDEDQLTQNLYFLKADLIALKQELDADEFMVSLQKNSTAVWEIDRYLNNVTRLFKEQCFRENKGQKMKALTSLSAIAGILMKGSWGTVVTLGSKILQRTIDIGFNFFTNNRDDNILEPIEDENIFNGTMCAMRSLSANQCDLYNKDKMYQQVQQYDDISRNSSCYNNLIKARQIESLVSDASSIVSTFSRKLNEENIGTWEAKNNIDFIDRFKRSIRDMDFNIDQANIVNKQKIVRLNAKFQKSGTDNNQRELLDIELKDQRIQHTEIIIDGLKTFVANKNHKIISDVEETRKKHQKMFLSLIFDEQEAEEIFAKMSALYVSEKEHEWNLRKQNAQDYEQEQFRVMPRFANHPAVDMFSYFKANNPLVSNEFPEEAPSFLKEIYDKVYNNPGDRYKKIAEESFLPMYERKLPRPSTVIQEKDQLAHLNSLESRNGKNMTIIESMDALIAQTTEIRKNRELLTGNIIQKMKDLGSNRKSENLYRSLQAQVGPIDDSGKRIGYVHKNGNEIEFNGLNNSKKIFLLDSNGAYSNPKKSSPSIPSSQKTVYRDEEGNIFLDKSSDDLTEIRVFHPNDKFTDYNGNPLKQGSIELTIDKNAFEDMAFNMELAKDAVESNWNSYIQIFQKYQRNSFSYKHEENLNELKKFLSTYNGEATTLAEKKEEFKKKLAGKGKNLEISEEDLSNILKYQENIKKNLRIFTGELTIDEKEQTNGNPENLSIIQREISSINQLWSNQLDNIFDIDGNRFQAVHMLRSGILGEYLTQTTIFESNREDIQTALLKNEKLSMQNINFFKPYLKQAAKTIDRYKKSDYKNILMSGYSTDEYIIEKRKKLKKLKEEVDQNENKINKAKINGEIKEIEKFLNEFPGAEQAKVEAVRRFCLEALGFPSVPQTVQTSCSGVIWIDRKAQPNRTLSFAEEIQKDDSKRVCTPGNWRASTLQSKRMYIRNQQQ